MTPGFLPSFGIRPAIGRGFEAADFERGRPQVVLISHRLWRTRFAGDSAIVGRAFQAYVSDRPDEAETFTIVGVLPSDFWHTNPYTEVLAPLRASAYPYMVRLREGVTPENAAHRITELVRSGGAALPAGWRVAMRSAHAAYVAQARPPIIAASVAAMAVLLIACANVAVLLLIRASRRQQEIALRLALGATRGRIALLLAAEGLAIGGAATIAGLILSWNVVGWLTPVLEGQLGRQAPGGMSALVVDGTVVIAAAAAGLATVCLVTLAPLAACWRTRASSALAGGVRGATDGPALRRVRGLLIAFEVAASLALVSPSALMVSSAVRMLNVDLGMRTERVLTAGTALRARAYPNPERRAAFYAQVPARLARVPGVESVALTDWWPLQPPRKRRLEVDSAEGAVQTPQPVQTSQSVQSAQAVQAAQPAQTVQGGQTVEGGQAGQVVQAGHVVQAEAGVTGVSADYFATLGIPHRAGRTFTDRDTQGSEPVAIVSETMARQLWPRASALGRRLLITRDDEPDSARPPAWHTVVGIVGDVRHGHADTDQADVYVPLLQRADRFAFLQVRLARASSVGAALPAAEQGLREALAEIDPEVSMGAPRFLDAVADQERARPRFLASLLVILAVFAGLLALVGLYGTVAYAVRQREREIAIRMAVGADRRAVTRLFMLQGALVLAVGLTLGAGGAVASGRLLESQLFGVRSGDPWLLALTTLGFMACGLLAVWMPARRAAGLDPMAALKQEQL